MHDPSIESDCEAGGIQDAPDFLRRTLLVSITALAAFTLIHAADLAEALGNVLDNATHFARTEIVVAAERDGKYIRLDVEDDGPGVAEAALPEIAARGVHLVEGEGTGLELAITSDILNAYGGAIAFSRGVTGA